MFDYKLIFGMCYIINMYMHVHNVFILRHLIHIAIAPLSQCKFICNT